MSVASKVARNIVFTDASSSSSTINHPLLQYTGSKLTQYETKECKDRQANGNVYATSVAAQSDFELLRGMMGLK